MNEVQREIYEYIDKNSQRFVEDLIKLCKQPSISTQNIGINDCVELVQSMMGEVGIEAEIIQTKGHPMLLGLQKLNGAEKTIGFYNHYDVQPPEPLELWETPPFSADIREGKIYARGVSDNKGNIMARIKAVEAIKAQVETVVNLGAGFDTLVYRVPALANVLVYEVDQPINTEAKRKRLAKVLGKIPSHVTLVPIDFDQQDLFSVLSSHGHSIDKKTFFILEGVTQYVTEAGVRQTFDFLSNYSIKTELNIETIYSIHYFTQCWGVRMEYVDRPDDRAYMVVITLRGLGEVGTFNWVPGTPTVWERGSL